MIFKLFFYLFKNRNRDKVVKISYYQLIFEFKEKIVCVFMIMGEW